MSEKIYVLLLRLYPSHFREQYGAAALQLYRDRARDEKGFLSGLRLWTDLLADLVLSVPRQYLYVQPSFAGVARPHAPGMPSFFVLEGESLPAKQILLGGILSLAFLCVFWISLNSATKHTAQPAIAYRSSPHHSASRQPRALQPPSVPAAKNFAVSELSNLDAAQRRRVIDGAIAKLNEYYVYPDLGRQMAEALAAHQQRGDYNSISDAETFAVVLTTHLREVSHDRHLFVGYNPEENPANHDGPTPTELARYRSDMQRNNCTFEKVEILPRNIGYLKFNEFPDPAICRPTVTAVMKKLNNADAIIFDLRDNHGGDPQMVSLIASYLFNRPTHVNDIYDRRKNSTRQFWTKSPVSGNALADKRAYVLTSSATFSGAEEFAYDLKMLKRATVVGETTTGGAHPARTHQIDEHFRIRVPEARPINPVSKKNWEGTGVEPDVKVNAADALDTAQTLAEQRHNRH